MRDAAGQNPEALQTLRLLDLDLQHAPLELDLLALRDVPHGAPHPQPHAVLGMNRRFPALGLDLLHREARNALERLRRPFQRQREVGIDTEGEARIGAEFGHRPVALLAGAQLLRAFGHAALELVVGAAQDGRRALRLGDVAQP